MDWSAIATGIAFVICGILLWVFMPKAKVFYDVENTIDENDCDKILSEIKKETPIEQLEHFTPLYYDEEFCEKNYGVQDLLNKIPYEIRTVALIRIPPRFRQKKQWGIASYANHILRCYVTLQHSATKKSGIWVDGEKKFFSNGCLICFDPTREHSLFNTFGYESAVVLMIDIVRNIPGNSPNIIDLEKDEIYAAFEGKNIVDNDSTDGYSLIA